MSPPTKNTDATKLTLATRIGLKCLRIGSRLPLPVARIIGSSLGLATMLANKKRRDIAKINLNLCFPEMTQAQRDRLLRKSYQCLGQGVFDLGRLWWNSNDEIDRLTSIEGLEYYQAALKTGKPIILLTSHKPGTDFAGVAISKHHPTACMMNASKNKTLNDLLIKGRSRFNGKIIHRDQGLKVVIRAMRKENITFYFTADEDMGEEHSVFTPFFGVSRATLTTLSRLCKITGAIVIPCFGHITKDGYKTVLYPPLDNYPSDDTVADAARMNAAIEHDIRRAPEQYMWTFKWFKTRPEGEPPLYKKTRKK